MSSTASLPSRQRQLIFVMAQVNKQWRRTLDKVLAPLGLTQALWLPLVHLERSAGGMRQKDLAQALALDSSSVVRLIDGLEAQGWVERLDDADRRVKRIQLTTAGLAQVETVKTIVADVRSEVMQELAPDLLDATLDALETMLEKMAALEMSADAASRPGS